MDRYIKKFAVAHRVALISGAVVASITIFINLDRQTTPPSQPITITAAQPSTAKPQAKTTPKPSAKTPAKPKKVTPQPAPRTAPKPAPSPIKPSPVSAVHQLTPKPSTSTSSSSGAGSASGTGSSSGSSSSSSGGLSGSSYTSINWAGYVAAKTHTAYTDVAASWVVPQPTGNGSSTSADGTWIGIGGVTTGDLIQIGTNNTVSAGGNVSTEAFYEMLPNPSVTVPGVSVAPGDSVSASINEVSAGQWKISVTNNTNHESYNATVTYTSSSLSSAEWIEEDPSYANGQLVPLDNFGTVTFTSATATVDGVPESISAASPSAFTMVTQSPNPTPMATPSSISSTGFTVTRN